MPRETYHPNASLTHVRNTKRGLRARSSILTKLQNSSGEATSIAREAGLSYGSVMHHLKLLVAEGIVTREGRRPYMWMVSGLGQKRLLN
jgi:predicted transcriptional regulator